MVRARRRYVGLNFVGCEDVEHVLSVGMSLPLHTRVSWVIARIKEMAFRVIK